MSRLLTHVLFPLTVFPLFTFTAIYFMFYQSFVPTGGPLKVSTICDSDLASQPYRLAYTNNINADKFLCNLVTFFHTLMNSAYHPLIAVVFSTGGVAVLVPFLEDARNSRPFALRMPTVITALFQFASVGVIMPIYSLLFVSMGTASIRPSSTLTSNPPSKSNQCRSPPLWYCPRLRPPHLPHALLRTTFCDRCLARLPFVIALCIFAHKVIRPPSRYGQSGHPTVMTTLAFTFVLSALIYAVYVWPALTDSVALRTNFMPTIVLEFLKRDLIIFAGSIVLATFWMADGVLCLAGILAWYGVASIALGPAAAIVGVFLWRERRLNGRIQTEKASKRTD